MARPEAMIAEAFRVCKPGGRLVLVNITPYTMQDTALYEWFPDALESDLATHPSPRALQEFAVDAGFVRVQVHIQTVGGDLPLGEVAAKYSSKDSCSQLNAMPQPRFDACLARLRAAGAADPTRLAADRTDILHLVVSRPV
jgi:hypothetical protein